MFYRNFKNYLQEIYKGKTCIRQISKRKDIFQMFYRNLKNYLYFKNYLQEIQQNKVKEKAYYTLQKFQKLFIGNFKK